MSGQVFTGSSLDVRSGRTGLPGKLAPRGTRPSIDSPAGPKRSWLSVFKPSADRLEFEAVSPALAPRRRALQLGILLHLVCVGAVGTAVAAVFIGAGLYSLRNPSEEFISKSWAYKHSGSGSTALTDSTPAGVAPGPSVSPLIAASLGVLAADPVQPGGVAALGAQVPQLTAGGKPFDAAPDPRAEATQAQSGAHSDPRRPRNASSEVVSGMIAEASDAMTWIVDDQVVHLWGVRPGPRNSRLPLTSIVDWARFKGPVKCHKQPHSNRYQCFTAAREDIAEAALLAGLGRVAGGASPAYREAEAQAHQQGKGIWAKS